MSNSTTEYIDVTHGVRAIQDIEKLSYEEVQLEVRELKAMLDRQELTDKQRADVGRAIGWATFELTMRDQTMSSIESFANGDQ